MEPLNLPRGSVRSIIVLSLIVATVIVTILVSIEAAAGLSTLTGVAVRDYFGTRVYQNQQDGPVLHPPSQ